MILNKLKNFCPAPFRQLCVNAQGHVSPCCMINSPFFGKLGDQADQSIDAILNSSSWKNFLDQHINEEMPPVCETACGNRFSSEYHLQWAWAKMKNWKEKEFSHSVVDLSFSNICNLACTMCSSDFSSTWNKIDLQMNTKNSVVWNFNLNQTIQLANRLKSYSQLHIKGGEPFINPLFHVFLRHLADLNNQIHIPVLTNGTVVNDSALEQLSRFANKPTISFSMETTQNLLYQFIRGGEYTFDHILKNIFYIKKNYPLLTIRINFLMTAWSINYVIEDLKKLINYGFDEINLMFINNPVEQSIAIVRPSIRKKLASDILELSKKFPKQFDLMLTAGTLAPLLQQLEQIEQPSNKEQNDQFQKNWINNSNRHLHIRNNIQKVSKSFPDHILGLVPDYLENTCHEKVES